MSQGSGFGGFADVTASTGIENRRQSVWGGSMFWAGKILFEVPIGHVCGDRHRGLFYWVNLRRSFSTPDKINWKHNCMKGNKNLIDSNACHIIVRLIKSTFKGYHYYYKKNRSNLCHCTSLTMCWSDKTSNDQKTTFANLTSFPIRTVAWRKEIAISR